MDVSLIFDPLKTGPKSLSKRSLKKESENVSGVIAEGLLRSGGTGDGAH